MIANHALRKLRDGNAIRSIDDDRGHPFATGDRLVECIATAPGHDDMVARRVEPLCQRTADARPAACDQDRITGRIYPLPFNSRLRD